MNGGLYKDYILQIFQQWVFQGVDIFASYANEKALAFCSRLDIKPLSLGDACQIWWTGTLFHVFLSFSLIYKVMTKI